MDIQNLLKRSVERNETEPEKAKYLASEILVNSPLFSLLKNSNSLKQRITELDAKHSTKKAHKKEGRITLDSFFPIHRMLLDCHENDEHVVFLSALKALEEGGHDVSYKEVLKEILMKNLHKIELKSGTVGFVGRTKELGEIERTLSKSSRNSVLVIGPGGIGKTTLAHESAHRIKKRHVFHLFSGNSDFYDNVATILSEQSSKNALFFLDELFSFEKEHIQYLVTNTQFISTANDHSYRKFASEHPDIVSKIEVITLEEPERDDLQKILYEQSERLRQEFSVAFEEKFIDEIVNLAKQYMQDSFFPAKGISLLEEAVSLAKNQSRDTVSIELLRSLISQKTNIPIGSLTELDKKDLSELPQKLSSKVKGQEDAIQSVSRVIQRSKLGFGKKNRPIGSFLFVGPSGVGKTELAKAVASEIFGDSENMVRIDMSEFAEAHTVQRLVGAPPGYIGFEEGGQLTNPIKAKPYNLILLDEIEKAHPRVFDIFLQVLDDGRLTDGQGKIVDFKNTVIIATSNAGIEDILDLIEEGKSPDEIKTELKNVLQDYFRIEFINRFDDIIIFNALTPPALKKIAVLQIEKLKHELLKRNISFDVSEKTLEHIAHSSFDPRYGARGLLRFIQEKIENQLAEMIIDGRLAEGQRIEF